MRTSIQSLIIAGAVAAITGAASAQPSARIEASAAPPPAARCCTPPLPEATVASFAARAEEASALAQRGELKRARTVLRALIRDERRSGAYAARSLRQLADVQFALGHPTAAAGTLRSLAWEAERVDDDATELLAWFDAVVIYMQEGKREQAQELMPRIRRLLRSPLVPEETRNLVAGQLRR